MPDACICMPESEAYSPLAQKESNQRGPMLLCCSAVGCGGASDSSPVMGATRLMVLLAGISKLVKLGKQCRAQRVGVDLFGWLHQS
jgi:hypothetical protein